jgi:hypothetical protein
MATQNEKWSYIRAELQKELEEIVRDELTGSGLTFKVPQDFVERICRRFGSYAFHLINPGYLKEFDERQDRFYQQHPKADSK